MCERELIELLRFNDIKIEEWGKGNSKTINHLLDEIKAHETNLRLTVNGELVRETSFLTIDVYYRRGQDKFKLYEDRQVFTDGRTRRRNYFESLQEKIRQGEDVVDAAKRAIKEELGIQTEVKWRVGVLCRKEERESSSYPGLHASYTIYEFAAELDEKQFDPSGYVEIQPDKVTFFRWRKVS